MDFKNNHLPVSVHSVLIRKENPIEVTANFFSRLLELVPPSVEKELRNLYLSLSELLKHFWNSFPPTTPECEAKAVRMHEALQRFQMAKLKPFEVKFL